MGYKTTAQADEDLIQAFFDGIQKFGVAQAQRYQEELAYVFDLLADQPGLGRRMKARPGSHIHHHGRHHIVYYIDGSDVVIEGVIHTSTPFDPT